MSIFIVASFVPNMVAGSNAGSRGRCGRGWLARQRSKLPSAFGRDIEWLLLAGGAFEGRPRADLRSAGSVGRHSRGAFVESLEHVMHFYTPRVGPERGRMRGVRGEI